MSTYRWRIVLKDGGYLWETGYKTRAEANRAVRSAIKLCRKNNVRMKYYQIERMRPEPTKEKGEGSS